MATFSAQLLSGSTNGRAVKVAATATAGTLIHTAVTGTTSFDEIYLWVTNTSASSVNLTVEWGGVLSPDDLIVEALPIPGDSGPIPILCGQRLQNALVVRAFASTANVLLISGMVNRVAP